MHIDKNVFSNLPKLWLLDLDGTILMHNSHLDDSQEFVPGAIEFLTKIDSSDKIIFITARSSKYKELTESFLNAHNIKYDDVIYDMPHGERILINDIKPSGLVTAFAYNLKRDQGFIANE